MHGVSSRFHHMDILDPLTRILCLGNILHRCCQPRVEITGSQNEVTFRGQLSRIWILIDLLYCPKIIPGPWSTLRWRHNDHAGVSNHQPHGCLLNRLFRRKSKKTSKLRVTGLCAGNSPGTGEFPAQMASYAENVSIWWRHHGISRCHFTCIWNLIVKTMVFPIPVRWHICMESVCRIYGPKMAKN